MKKLLYIFTGLQFLSMPFHAQYFEDAGFPSIANNYVLSSFYDDETGTEYFGGTFVWELQGHWLPRIFKRTQGVIEPMGLGFNWSLEDPDENSGCQIRSILKYHGEIYVSGLLNYSGSTPIHGVAKWDGTAWSQVGDIDVVPDIRIVRDTLIAIGTFELDNINSICYWNEQAQMWLPYHDFPNFWLPGNSVNFISDVIEFNNEIYVGGNFQGTEAGAVDLVKWTGSQWVPVDGICGGISGVIDLDVYAGNLIVAGLFGEGYCPLSPGNGIASYDGTNWNDMQGGMNAQVNHVTVFDGQLFVAGPFTAAGYVSSDYFAKWDGNEWCGIGSDNGNYFNEGNIIYLDHVDGALYLSGPFFEIGGQPMAQLVQYIGGSDCIISNIKDNKPANNIISLYPNPASTHFSLELSDEHEVKEISFYNGMGQRVGMNSYSSGQGNSAQHEISVSHLAPGCYTVVVRYENKVVRAQVVVE